MGKVRNDFFSFYALFGLLMDFFHVIFQYMSFSMAYFIELFPLESSGTGNIRSCCVIFGLYLSMFSNVKNVIFECHIAGYFRSEKLRMHLNVSRTTETKH